MQPHGPDLDGALDEIDHLFDLYLFLVDDSV